MYDIQPLIHATRAQLHKQMREGYPCTPEELAGFVYEGISLGLPRWAERLSWKKFQKAFVMEPEASYVRGWNIRTVDDGLENPWRDQCVDGVPNTFGHFIAEQMETGVCLDYSRQGLLGNGVLNGLRDPLVALQAGDPTLILGRSTLSVFGKRWGTPSYFLLRRGREVSFIPPAP